MAKFATAAWTSGVSLGLALSIHGGGAAAPAGPDLVQWLAANTDMAPAQVAIAGPDYVYTLEPVGPRTLTGEQIALVRTERLDAAGGAASWEAHLLIDCAKRRLRQIRGATFPQPNRTGAPVRDTPSDAWIQPEAGQPAMQLLAAGCDPQFAWPLRNLPTAEAAAPASPPEPVSQATAPASPPEAVSQATAPPPPQAQTTIMAQAEVEQPAVAAASPQAASPATAPTPSQPQTIIIPQTEPAERVVAPIAAPPPTFGVQIARGPSEEGASRALTRARKALGERAQGLSADIERSQVGDRRRFTAVLLGFPTAEAATEACRALQDDGQACFVRDPPAPAGAAAPSVAAVVPRDAFAVQVARGPSEEGARRALASGRKTLGGAADGLVGAVEESRVGERRRYTAVLAGFASGEAADQACKALSAAGQSCFTRSPARAAAEDESR